MIRLMERFATVPVAAMLVCLAAAASAQQRRPNILVIMGDDVGWMNVSS